MVTIKRVSPDVVFANPDYPALEASYMSMAHDALKVGASVMKDRYRQLYDTDVLDTFTVEEDGGKLIGFAAVIYSPSLHTGHLCANVESIFIDPNARSTGAGIGLMCAIRTIAKARGCAAVFYSAQPGSKFDRLLGRMKGTKLAQHIYMQEIKRG